MSTKITDHGVAPPWEGEPTRRSQCTEPRGGRTYIGHALHAKRCHSDIQICVIDVRKEEGKPHEGGFLWGLCTEYVRFAWADVYAEGGCEPPRAHRGHFPGRGMHALEVSHRSSVADRHACSPGIDKTCIICHDVFCSGLPCPWYTDASRAGSGASGPRGVRGARHVWWQMPIPAPARGAWRSPASRGKEAS
jgi:hypothetical protein